MADVAAMLWAIAARAFSREMSRTSLVESFTFSDISWQEA
jgi:hypothetical protein